MPYSYATLSEARQQLANRLYDPAMVFWTAAELTLYIQEALQTFNALAQYWRGDFVFNTAASTTWYDLTQVANTLRPYTVTDVDLYTLMEYHLLEPPTGATWTGTQQFDINDLLNAVQRRMDEALGVTGCTITRSTQLAPAAIVRNALADDVIDLRRVAWFPTPVAFTVLGNTTTGSATVAMLSITTALQIGQTVTGAGIPANTTIQALGFSSITLSNAATATATGVVLTVTPQLAANVVWPEDVWSFQAFEPDYGVAPQGVPSSFSVSAQPPLMFDTDVAPQQEGSYELLTVNAGPTLSTGTPTLLPIPTDFAWIVKWGALADLLSKEAEAKDSPRAEYANQRYQQGLKLLAMAPAALQIRVNNVPVWMDAVRSADEYQTDWQQQAQGQPVSAFLAGLNLMALSPQPSGTQYAVSASVVENAPLPVADGDFVQVARDDYDVIIDYAQHLCLFKNGGAEFTETKPLYNRLVQQAARYNSKLAESGCFENEIYGSSQREETMNPRFTKSMANAQAGGEDNG